MPVGLASLVMQLQAFVTILLGLRVHGRAADAQVQIIAAVVALLGIGVIGSARLARRELLAPSR